MFEYNSKVYKEQKKYLADGGIVWLLNSSIANLQPWDFRPVVPTLPGFLRNVYKYSPGGWPNRICAQLNVSGFVRVARVSFRLSMV